MKEYWNKRFSDENKIWGDNPSKTAEYALKIFKERQLSDLFIPGIGYGRNADLFIKNNFTVEGIEISETAIDLAGKENRDLKIYQGSVLEMPFSNKIYNCIYCFNVLHLFRKDDRLLFIEKCSRQLAPEGIVFFAVFSDKESSYGKGQMVEENTFESKPGRPVHYFSEEDLIQHFDKFDLLETGLMEDTENHGKEKFHKHIVRYIIGMKK